MYQANNYLKKIAFAFCIACFFNQSLADTDQHDHEHKQDHDDEFTALSSHVHGEAIANITFVSSILMVELSLPAINVFGFEHQAKNADQQEVISSQLSTLKQADAILNLSPDCLSKHIEVTSNFESSHDHHEHHDDEHNDVVATYQFQCNDIDEVEANFTVFEKMNDLHKILVQFVSEHQQNSFTVTHEKPTITLH